MHWTQYNFCHTFERAPSKKQYRHWNSPDSHISMSHNILSKVWIFFKTGPVVSDKNSFKGFLVCCHGRSIVNGHIWENLYGDHARNIIVVWSKKLKLDNDILCSQYITLSCHVKVIWKGAYINNIQAMHHRCMEISCNCDQKYLYFFTI